MSQTTHGTLPTIKARAIASLEHLTPTWFVLVLGWCGLSLAWLRATDILGEQALGLGLSFWRHGTQHDGFDGTLSRNDFQHNNTAIMLSVVFNLLLC